MSSPSKARLTGPRPASIMPARRAPPPSFLHRPSCATIRSVASDDSDYSTPSLTASSSAPSPIPSPAPSQTCFGHLPLPPTRSSSSTGRRHGPQPKGGRARPLPSVPDSSSSAFPVPPTHVPPTSPRSRDVRTHRPSRGVRRLPSVPALPSSSGDFGSSTPLPLHARPPTLPERCSSPEPRFLADVYSDNDGSSEEAIDWDMIDEILETSA